MDNDNYLKWLAEETPTKWWHDSAIPEEIEKGLANGALGVTTNPVLTYKTLQARPQYWAPFLKDIHEDLEFEERAEALLKIVATNAAGMVKKIYDITEGKDGYAFGQLNPTLAGDAEGMMAMARRIISWAPNIAVKLPTTQAGLDVMEELAANGYATCTTINFSVAQAIAVGERYRKGIKRAIKSGIKPAPCFAVQQVGRLDDYLRDAAKDMKLGIAESDIQKAGIAVAKRSYGIYRKEGYEAVIMPAGLRGTYHLTGLSGGHMTFSIHPRVQKMVLESKLPYEKQIDVPVDPKVIERLMKIPEFVRAYEPDALSQSEFITFGIAQKTLSQFVETGWSPLEVYGSNKASARWT